MTSITCGTCGVEYRVEFGKCWTADGRPQIINRISLRGSAGAHMCQSCVEKAPRALNLLAKTNEVLDVHGIEHDRAVDMVRAGCELAAKSCGTCRSTENTQGMWCRRYKTYMDYCSDWEPKPDDGREGE